MPTKMKILHLFPLLLFSLLNLPVVAQSIEVRTASVTSKPRKIDKNTRIYDQETGKRISMEEYFQSHRDTPNDFRFIPQIDEYGEIAYYVRRKSTGEEKESGITLHQGDYKKPILGQALPSFVMKGADGKTYKSEELKGKYILLSFWLKFEKPFFRGDSETQDLAKLIEIASKKGVELVSLGTTSDSKERCLEAMSEYKLGLLPVPESFEFMKRYGIFNPATYLLVGPDGNLLAIVEQETPLPLQKYLVN
jgi:peroxiredoxin